MNEQTQFVIDKLDNPHIKTVLNIGYRYDSDTTIQKFVESQDKTFYVLEAWKENCESLITKNICKRVYNGDVRNIETINKKFDAIIWLHGPEHIIWDDFLTTRIKIENMANNIIIYQAPINEYPQGELYNNPYEKHVQALTPEMFKLLSYNVVEHNKNGEFTFSAYIQKGMCLI
jgi:hypothetical protein